MLGVYITGVYILDLELMLSLPCCAVGGDVFFWSGKLSWVPSASLVSPWRVDMLSNYMKEYTSFTVICIVPKKLSIWRGLGLVVRESNIFQHGESTFWVLVVLPLHNILWQGLLVKIFLSN